MKHVLVTVSKGIIEDVMFFDDPGKAIHALSDFVKAMNVEHHDAALYDEDGLVANAKHFLNDRDEFIDNRPLVEAISGEENRSIYIIGNPRHPLGFMVASPDDPLGYDDPVEALSELGQMRKDFGMHLKLYRVTEVDCPVVQKTDLKKKRAESEIEDLDEALIEEYLL